MNLRQEWVYRVATIDQPASSKLLLRAIEKTVNKLTEEHSSLCDRISYTSKPNPSMVIRSESRVNSSALVNLEWDKEGNKNSSVGMYFSDDPFEGDEENYDKDDSSILINIVDEKSYADGLLWLSLFLEKHFDVPRQDFYETYTLCFKEEKRSMKFERKAEALASKLSL